MRPNEEDAAICLPLPPDPKPESVTVIDESTAQGQSPVVELISPLARLIDLSAIVIPFAIFVAAIFLFWGRGLNWGQAVIMFAMYIVTGFGVTVGFHRLFTHRAFTTPASVRVILAILGSMSVQGPLLWWVALHRKHHQHSDGHGDPHSPHTHGGGVRAILAGAWHSHVGWLFRPDEPGSERYIPDLLKETALVKISRSYPLWVVLSLLIPAAAGGAMSHSWAGALWGFVWGGVTRVFLVHHITWSVNSVCHLWGSRPYDSHDHSRNNAVVGLLALGEGWHNNHHAFPTSARHGLHWWQPDSSYWVIRLMAAAGLASGVKVPAARAIHAKRKQKQAA